MRVSIPGQLMGTALGASSFAVLAVLVGNLALAYCCCRHHETSQVKGYRGECGDEQWNFGLVPRNDFSEYCSKQHVYVRSFSIY
jgi:hypothetical protein